MTKLMTNPLLLNMFQRANIATPVLDKEVEEFIKSNAKPEVTPEPVDESDVGLFNKVCVRCESTFQSTVASDALCPDCDREIDNYVF